ncbi:5-oxoprolinase subunit PxpA [Aquimarina sp. RZ0]|uniref:5-oxoprolinase subunit PxpA n=1 Tax=Aquimarina sp. RZ0 TaxID=2607730 RepID=UPI0011F31F34|nr:5-oxoprolinase subunit PxpA [Aquimarina sp. RZ0]KAA1242644.1 5-oxoprolinase subunit PxpA [Aquimarina sp. RZ0]
MNKKVLLNSDVGEEIGFDDQILPYVSWCNIACGAHAGNEDVIKKTIDLALLNMAEIGAHPSYPDRENFGRKVMNISFNELVATLTNQIFKVKTLTESAGGVLHHVKPHGALYNEAMKNEEVARAILNAVKNVDASLYIITQKESMISYLCDDHFRVRHEAFADRNYNEDLSLVSRLEKNAVLSDPEKVFNHVYTMVSDQKVKTIKGEERSIFFDTICVHGDTPKSVQILEYMHKRFLDLNFILK